MLERQGRQDLGRSVCDPRRAPLIAFQIQNASDVPLHERDRFCAVWIRREPLVDGEGQKSPPIKRFPRQSPKSVLCFHSLLEASGANQALTAVLHPRFEDPCIESHPERTREVRCHRGIIQQIRILVRETHYQSPPVADMEIQIHRDQEFIRQSTRIPLCEGQNGSDPCWCREKDRQLVRRRPRERDKMISGRSPRWQHCGSFKCIAHCDSVPGLSSSLRHTATLT